MSWDDEEEADTNPCPHCGADVYEDAERCPHCEQYLSGEDAPTRHPAWLVVGVVVCLVIAVLWVWHGR